MSYVCKNVCACVSFNRTPGNKPGSSPRGQTPDEAGRRHGQGHEGNSSVSDMANSVTNDMLMVTYTAHNCKLITAKQFSALMISAIFRQERLFKS